MEYYTETDSDFCISAVRADVVLCMYINNTNECVDCDSNVTTAHYITVDAAAYKSDNITLKLCSPSISLQTCIHSITT